MTAHTMGVIRARYDAKRNAILDRIRSGKCSASMSGIEYYPKFWDDLDPFDKDDAFFIRNALTWNGESHTGPFLQNR